MASSSDVKQPVQRKCEPADLLKQCFLPLKDQLSSEFLLQLSQMAVDVHHKGFSGTSDDLSQLRIALNGLFLRRMGSHHLSRTGDENSKRFLLQDGFSLPAESQRSSSDGCHKHHFGEICVRLRNAGPNGGAAGDSETKPFHVSPQPVISLKTRKKQDCPPFPQYLRLARQDVFAAVDRLEDLVAAEDVLDAAVKFQMLLIPWKTSLKLSFNPEVHSSLKDGVFVVYNAVRLASILEKYQQGVKQRLYLPIASDVDTSSFGNQELGVLLECSRFPEVLEKTLNTSKNKEIRTHLLPDYLLGLARKISLYYRNNQILKEPQAHLLPAIQARATLITAALNQFRHGLDLLDIRIPSKM